MVKDKSLGESADGGIDWLRGRFINLKNENKKLKERKSAINLEMEEVRANEKQTLSKLTNTLYER